MINTGPHTISMFDLPPAIRNATYTTNTIESVNSTIRPPKKLKRHKEPQAIPQSRLRSEVDLHSDSRGLEEVDQADSEMEGRPELLRNRVRGPDAQTHELM